jgi:ubiquitin-protein ligase
MSTVRLRRLQADYEKLRAFLGQQPRIRLIQTHGSPPERYQLEYQIRGLREVDDKLQAVANHMVEISLPLSYPRLPPQCRMLTPVFHPNIAPHAICIGDHWNAGEPLWSMVARIGEMIAYQSYNTKSPLNGEAARWVESNLDKLPLDKTNFLVDDAQPTDGPHNGEQPDPMLIPVANEHAAASPVASAPRPAIGSTAPQTSGTSNAAIPMAIPLPLRPSPPVAKLVGTPTEARAAPAAPTQAGSAAPNIVIQCGQCGTRYSVPGAAAGKKVRCKKCQAILLIPARQPTQ